MQSEEFPKYINPSVDGWTKEKEGHWIRQKDGKYEFLGRGSKQEVLSAEMVKSYYERRTHLEQLAKQGNPEVLEELKDVRKRIEYLDRYGPEVMGGVK